MDYYGRVRNDMTGESKCLAQDSNALMVVRMEPCTFSSRHMWYFGHRGETWGADRTNSSLTQRPPQLLPWTPERRQAHKPHWRYSGPSHGQLRPGQFPKKGRFEYCARCRMPNYNRQTNRYD